jgi:uncharacterized protein involved in type VI secretion and phage assembly
MSDQSFVGLYTGRVENNIDPQNMGRIQVSVSDVGGSRPLTWAMPCLPVTGRNMGMFTVPPVGSGVWVQFLRGNTDYPVWMGGYYAAGESPSLARNVAPGISAITLQTSAGNGLLISDMPGGGILIRTAGGAKIEVTDAGITIATGQGAELTLRGPTVDINNGALTVR